MKLEYRLLYAGGCAELDWNPWVESLFSQLGPKLASTHGSC